MNMQASSILKGSLTLIPGITRALPFIGRGTGGTNSAEYCYNSWLKHLTFLHAHGMREMPAVVAELGPGDSIGVGLAAVLSGATQYYALDAVPHAATQANLAILEQMIDLFKSRAPRPQKGWPDFDHHLDDRLFPSHILTEERLAVTLDESRLARIRAALRDPGGPSGDISIRYIAPWDDVRTIPADSADLILSHSVLEHVVDLEKIYQLMRVWLRRGGWMSHQIDFRSHGLAREWNGHWEYPEWLWRLVVGSRPYLLNRQPWSVHQELIERNGHHIEQLMQRRFTHGLDRDRMARKWQNLPDDDMTCSGAFVQTRKLF